MRLRSTPTPAVLLAVLLPASLLLAGCTGAEPAQYTLSGVFTEQASQENITSLREQLEPYGVELVVLESFPMQYRVNGIAEQDCDAIVALLFEKSYIESVSTCEPPHGSE